MAQFNFLAFTLPIQDIGGSGLGFYGPGGFGTSIQVSQYNDNTYITDASGASAGPKAANVKWVHQNSGQIPTNDTRVLRDIPNILSTLNLRFTNATPVKVQNATVTIFDRVNPNSPASGVTTKVAQLIHPWPTQAPTGSGDTAWWSPGGSGGTFNSRLYDAPVALANSPGMSGYSPSGSNTVDTQHDWYLALSVSPDSIGSKSQFGLYVSVQYI